MIVVADTTPINYLILIDQIHILPALYGHVLIPPAVLEELQRTRTPLIVRKWMEAAPPWLQVRAPSRANDPLFLDLDRGEAEAILLAQELGAEQILIDDQAARKEAYRRAIPFTGTLGVLEQASLQGMLDLKTSLEHLKATSFFVAPALIARLLKKDE